MYNMEVTNDNKVELAKAFVLMAIGDAPVTDPLTGELGGLDSFPPVIFMDANVTEHKIGGMLYGLELKVRIGERLEVWYFGIAMGNFGGVLREDARGGNINFYLPSQVESPAGRSQLNLGPQLDIRVDSGQAYVEYYPNDTAWYFLTVDTNSTWTRDTVVFFVSGFPPDSSNVYVEVWDNVRNKIQYIGRVQTDSGSGSLRWVPQREETGICYASAGYADPSDPPGTYQGIFATVKRLTLERYNSGGKQETGTLPIFYNSPSSL